MRQRVLDWILLPALAGSVAAGPDLVGDLNEIGRRFEGVGGSGVILVAAGDEILAELGFGWSDAEARRAMKPENVVTMGSITKSFTALAVLRLVADGKLELDVTLGDHFENVPDDKRAITVRQMLTHTAGFVDAIGDDWDTGATREWFEAAALEMPLVQPPGTGFSYTNVGYSLLGMIVEDVAGMPYEAFLRESILDPLGMHATGYLTPDYGGDALAIGYQGTRRWGTVLERPMLADGPCWNLRANGGLHTTARDMHRLALALLEGGLLPSELARQAFEPATPDGTGAYGLGFGVDSIGDGLRRVGHSGGNDIFSAYFGLYPEAGLHLFVASTVSGISAMHLLQAVEATLFERNVPLPPKTRPMTPEELARLAGSFALEGDVSLELVAADRSLLVQLDEPSATAGDPQLAALVARTEDAFQRSFAGEHGPLRLAFGVDAPLELFGEREEKRQRAMQAEHGAFERLGVVQATPASAGADVVVRFEFENGERLLLARWRDGEIGELMFVDELPRAEFRLFPIGEGPGSPFETFEFGQGTPRFRLTFDAEGLVIDRGGKRERARRL